MTAICRHYRVFAFASLALSLMLLGAAQAAEFAVRNAQFRVTNGVVNMDADIDLPLSDAAREALGDVLELSPARTIYACQRAHTASAPVPAPHAAPPAAESHRWRQYRSCAARRPACARNGGARVPRMHVCCGLAG